jgi:uncharacterized protein YgfB (UPF0149 family)
MLDKNMPNFQKVEKEMSDNGLKLHPSEVHGLITGAICAQLGSSSSWDELLLEEGLSEQMAEVMKTLYAQTDQQLRAFLFDFALLLPDDHSMLLVRAEALTLWCQGFMTGLHDIYEDLSSAEPSDVTEALHDLVEIAKMNFEEVIPSEEDESAYVELLEYVRMAVTLIYQSTHELDQPDTQSMDTKHLH